MSLEGLDRLSSLAGPAAPPAPKRLRPRKLLPIFFKEEETMLFLIKRGEENTSPSYCNPLFYLLAPSILKLGGEPFLKVSNPSAFLGPFRGDLLESAASSSL